MSIYKSLNQAPLGMQPGQMSQEPDLEIEIEDPDSVDLSIAGHHLMHIDPDAEDVTPEQAAATADLAVAD